ncbi:MAG: cell division protein FtsL [Azoarcus sp.]|jgi:cell division protein FtsL|nr:cell division protein FtsL [Azoarcus sp.]
MIRFEAFFGALLVVLAIFSAIGVIKSRDVARNLYSGLEAEQKTERELNKKWGDLQIEQSSLITHRNVEKIARERLGMLQPQAGQILVLEDKP